MSTKYHLPEQSHLELRIFLRIWNRDEKSITENILFIDNVCLNAGYGCTMFSARQNGCCVMFYSNTAQTKNFVLKGNFCKDRKPRSVRRRLTPEQPIFTENTYWQDDKAPYVRWRGENYLEKDFDAWREQEGQEKGAKIEKVDVDALIPAL